jgi:hypothetical protein
MFAGKARRPRPQWINVRIQFEIVFTSLATCDPKSDRPGLGLYAFFQESTVREEDTLDS